MDASTSICQKGKVTPLQNRFFKKRHTNCLSYFALGKNGYKKATINNDFYFSLLQKYISFRKERENLRRKIRFFSDYKVHCACFYTIVYDLEH